MNLEDLRTIKQCAEELPAFSENAIRHLIQHRNINGFAGCFPRVGGRRLVDVPRLIQRIEEQNAEDSAA